MNVLNNVIIFDHDRLVKTGLSSLINWSRFNFKPIKEKIPLENLNIIDYFNGVILCEDNLLKDNLKAIEHIRSRPEIMKFIIMTAEENMSCLQTALSVKADWILEKPIKIDRLHEILELINKSNQEPVKTKANVTTFNLQLLNEFAFTKQPDTFNIKELEKETALFNNRYYVLNLHSSEKQYNPKFQFIYSLNRLVQLSFEPNFTMISFMECNNNMFYILYPGKLYEYNIIDNEIHKKSMELIETVSKNLGVEITISLSSMGSSIKNLPNLIKQSNLKMEQLFFSGKGIVYNKAPFLYKCKANSLNREITDNIIQDIKAGKVENLAEHFKYLHMDIKTNQNPTVVKHELIELLMRILTLEINILEQFVTEPGLLGSQLQAITLLDTLAEMIEYIFNLGTISCKRIFENLNINNSKIITRVINYVDSHYQDPISLESVAKTCYISPSYLSRIFKRIVGDNFNEYLTDLRLLNAKRLLVDTKYKTYQIAEKVGIYDSNYFSRIFKKKVHITPSQYRDRNVSS